MWILPRQLHTSAFVPDTEALISDSTEQSQICAQSLLARSKPSPARTWSQRWKRDSWTQHLSGRILKPSHGPSFVTAWTSALSVIHASHLVQPVNDSEQKIPDTSGHLLQPELLKCDQVSVSPKTSRDISALGYPTCCKTWQDWVTERRGAWRARVNAARLTRGKESSSWLTISTEDACRAGSAEGWKEYEDGNRTTQARLRNQIHNWPTARTNDSAAGRPNDGKDRIGKNGERFGINLSDKVIAEQNWPSPVASEVRQGFQDRSKGMKGSQESLTTVVIKHGQAAPASSSSLGSRQGLSVDWRTPQAQEAGAKVETLFTKDGAPAMPGQRAYRKTPSGKLVLQSQTINQQVEMVQNWATPRTPTGGPESAQRKQELGRTTSGGGDLASQASGKLSSQWVCTLMGLPMGWVSPSCPASVIKNWPRFVTGWLQATTAPTSCDSSGTALCQPPQSERSDFLLAS
jgi:hypothetical protein